MIQARLTASTASKSQGPFLLGLEQCLIAGGRRCQAQGSRERGFCYGVFNDLHLFAVYVAAEMAMRCCNARIAALGVVALLRELQG